MPVLFADPDSLTYRVTLMVLAFIVTLVALSWAKLIIWKRLEQWADRSATRWDDALIQALNVPVWVLLVFMSISMSVSFAPAEIRKHIAITQGWKIVVVLLCFWLVDRVVKVLFKEGWIFPDLNQQIRSVMCILARAIILSIGVLIVLDSLGVSITPLLASLGVGSLAVALALQDTLGNVFSGVYMLVDQPFRIGDYIRLEDDTEGIVEKMGWRTTRIRMLSNVTVIIPNSKIASSRLINYDLPVQETTLKVEVGVSYDADLAKVEKTVLEVAGEVQRSVDGAVPSFQPSMSFHTFADSSINFSVVLGLRQYVNRVAVRHEFIKALHARFKKESIEIPFPQRVVKVVE